MKKRLDILREMGINNSLCCRFMGLSKNKRYIENVAKPFILSFAILILCPFLFIACGKKAPPVVPRQVQPRAVKDLSYRLDGDTLKLTWTLPKGDEKNPPSLTTFILYQSKRSIAEKECLEKGFRYIYKVIALAQNGRTSDDSNYIRLNY
ncbi:MAG: hypothetical protein JRI32_03835 [Deltaproteobacteria bacterium]|nr:hypothetical protein [Deltaproteobacteria bacterium]